MPRVFTKVPGAVVEIGCYGTATNDTPAIVPDNVGKELDAQEGLRVERDEAVVPADNYATAAELGAAIDKTARKARKGEETR